MSASVARDGPELLGVQVAIGEGVEVLLDRRTAVFLPAGLRTSPGASPA
jgi:hypothetical protein